MKNILSKIIIVLFVFLSLGIKSGPMIFVGNRNYTVNVAVNADRIVADDATLENDHNITLIETVEFARIEQTKKVYSFTVPFIDGRKLDITALENKIIQMIGNRDFSLYYGNKRIYWSWIDNGEIIIGRENVRCTDIVWMLIPTYDPSYDSYLDAIISFE